MQERIPVGFECPPGTRLIIQRPDGFFVAEVEGTFRIVNHIEVNPSGLDEVLGATISLSMEAKPKEDGTLYRVQTGVYGPEGSDA